MPRLTGSQMLCALLAACTFQFGTPSTSEAGVIPWVYDAVFGPVGSMHRSYYAPYYTSQSSYGGVGYLPASYSYGYSTNGCSSCQQSSYYASTLSPCGCNPCAGGCSSGNCASGNCVVNSAPTGTLTPSPDPLNSSRSFEDRLEAIEKHLGIKPTRGGTTRGYEDPRDSFRPGTRTNRNLGDDPVGSGSVVPPRGGSGRSTVQDEFGADPGKTYSSPNVRGTGAAGGAETDLFEENPRRTNGAESGDARTYGVQRPTTNEDSTLGKSSPLGTKEENHKVEKLNTAPKENSAEGENKADDSSKPTTSREDNGDLVIPPKSPAPSTPVVEEGRRPASLRLDGRITTRAVSPLERQVIHTAMQKTAISKSKAPAPVLSPKPSWAGNSKSTDLALHR